MKTQKRPWTRAEKWFGALTVIVITTLGVWGWIDSRPTPPRLDLPKGAFVTSFLLSPDQHYLAVGTDVYDGYNAHTGAVVLWDARTLKQQRIFRTSQPIRTFCLSTGADKIGILNPAQNIFEWRDRASQKLLWSFAVPKPYLTFGRALFLKQKSQILLIAEVIGKPTVKPRVFLLSERDGSVQASWDSDSSITLRMALSSDGKSLAYREYRSKSLVLRRVEDGQIVRRWKVGRFGWYPVFSPDGHFFFMLGESEKVGTKLLTNTVKCIDLYTGQQKWSFDATQVASDINSWRRAKTSRMVNEDWIAFESIAISPDGATVAAMRSIDSTIYLLDSKTGELQKHLALPMGKAEYANPSSFSTLLFAPDGKHLFARTEGSIFAWDLTAK